MIKLEDINKEISFDAETHTYRDKNGRELISVSTLLNLYKNPFDPEGHIARACARREGVEVRDILLKWEKAKNEGLQRGTSFHKQMEHYIKTKEILDEDFKDVIKKFIFNFGFKSHNVICEIPVSNLEYMIGGTIDVIEIIEDNVLNLIDWKSNKSIDKKSKYRKQLIHPLNDYDECSFNVYTFQLNLYKFILESHGYKVKKMTLFHVDSKEREIIPYEVPNVKKDVIKLLNHYKSLQSF